MADYWKSQPRKFCEFCKCWIADNKPSREFHEKGKKHQENVQKKIDEVMKKGRQAAAEKEKMSDTLLEMEKAALQALKKDLQRDPSLAAQYGVKIKKKELTINKPTDQVSESSRPSPDDSDSSGQQSDSTEKCKEEPEDKSKPDPNLVWKEEWTPEGFVYYWNTETGESVWEKPEGYVPTWERAVKEQQQSDEDIELEPVTSSTDNTGKAEEEGQSDDGNEEPDEEKTENEVAAPIPVQDIPLPKSEELPKPEVTDDTSVPVPDIGPPTRTQATKRATTSAYGEWESVKKEPESAPIDLELPVKKEHAPEQVKTITISEPKIKFRQKKVDTLGAEFVAFKKRKMAASQKANVRKTDSENV